MGAVLDAQGNEVKGEARLLAPLLAWLMRTRRVNAQTEIAYELVWFGRRIDVATLSATRRASAYELKIGSLGRAMEQASYNRLAFNRSFVVTNALPRAENLAIAAEHDIGVIVVQEGGVREVLQSPLRAADPVLRARLLTRFRDLRRSCDV
jgi:hypothetical protein